MLGKQNSLGVFIPLLMGLCVVVGLEAFTPSALAQSLRFDALHRMIPTDRDETFSIALGDVDNDGDLDAFIGNEDGGQNRLYINDGTGDFFDATSQLPVGDSYTRCVALGDVDGDGDLDAFICNVMYFDAQNQLFVNDGTGVFSDATSQIPSYLDETTSVALGDVDNDGDLDAFVGNGRGPEEQNHLFINDGTGVFSDATSQIPSYLDKTFSVALGDVDDDGDLDAYLGNADQNRLYLNDGTGVFSDATSQIPAIDDWTLCVALADVDGDGDIDVMTGNEDLNRLYANDGTGNFSDVSAQIPPGGDTSSVAFGDVDNDADLDMFLGRGEQNRLYINNGSGVFYNFTHLLPDEAVDTESVALGDVDGDGDLDAMIGNGDQSSAYHNRLYLNNGTDGFVDVTSRMEDEDSWGLGADLGDVDGDGDLDVMTAEVYQNRLFVNDGSGFFIEATSQLPYDDDGCEELALGDVDNDGDLDAYLGIWDIWDGQDRLYLNDGTGVFTDATSRLPVDNDFTTLVKFGDVDNDGDLDVFLASFHEYTDEPNRLYINLGTHFLDASSQLPGLSEHTISMAFGDVDGDGDLDAFIGDLRDQDRLYLNDGTGLFSDATSQIPAGNFGTLSVALGDVDGDGDLDVFTGNGGQNHLFINDGTGVFSDATSQLPIDDDRYSDVQLGDVDGDGDLDAFIANRNGEQDRLYINDGTGVFFDATSQLPVTPYSPGYVVFGDLDGDGDLDAMIPYCFPEVVYSNLTRHLSWRGIPRIGKPLTLDVCGPAAGWYLFVASPQSNYYPYPPYGVLRILYSAAIYEKWGALDSDGRASIPFQVPDLPGLVGLSIYGQALVGPPARLTNLEVATFTDL